MNISECTSEQKKKGNLTVWCLLWSDSLYAAGHLESKKPYLSLYRDEDQAFLAPNRK